jgi:hypothetical protein
MPGGPGVPDGARKPRQSPGQQAYCSPIRMSSSRARRLSRGRQRRRRAGCPGLEAVCAPRLGQRQTTLATPARTSVKTCHTSLPFNCAKCGQSGSSATPDRRGRRVPGGVVTARRRLVSVSGTRPRMDERGLGHSGQVGERGHVADGIVQRPAVEVTARGRLGPARHAAARNRAGGSEAFERGRTLPIRAAARWASGRKPNGRRQRFLGPRPLEASSRHFDGRLPVSSAVRRSPTSSRSSRTCSRRPTSP